MPFLLLLPLFFLGNALAEDNAPRQFVLDQSKPYVGRPHPSIEPAVEASGCPAGETALSPGKPVGPTDYVQLERTACFGACPIYSVQIRGDGQVTWEGRGYVQMKGTSSIKVSDVDALALIERFRATAFWSLCEQYDRSVTDVPTTITVVHIADREKRVSDRAGGAPDWLRELDYEVDALADTHQWIHGDPRKELFDTLRSDGFGPKRGLTALMKAAAIADSIRMRELLEAKSDPDAQDSSGWTALMYAAQGIKLGRVDTSTYTSGIEAVKMLLDAGANPNKRSFMGQTALMAAVNAYYSSVERVRLLIASGADVNVQDAGGYTPLIHALHFSLGLNSPGCCYIQRAEVCTLLRRAGALTDLRDAEGLTAFDHLERDLKRFTSSPSYDKAMETQFEKLRQILRD